MDICSCRLTPGGRNWMLQGEPLKIRHPLKKKELTPLQKVLIQSFINMDILGEICGLTVLYKNQINIICKVYNEGENNLTEKLSRIIGTTWWWDMLVYVTVSIVSTCVSLREDILKVFVFGCKLLITKILFNFLILFQWILTHRKTT